MTTPPFAKGFHWLLMKAKLRYTFFYERTCPDDKLGREISMGLAHLSPLAMMLGSAVTVAGQSAAADPLAYPVIDRDPTRR
jgi:hypothetical protein